MIATALAGWAVALEPTPEDLALADLALVDTLAVAHAARDHPLPALVSGPAREAVAAHVLDYDDLHLASTTHISAVCVPAVRAAGGGAREYLAAAGVMARLGEALGWGHSVRGGPATCPAGAPAAAVGAALAEGADADGVATSIALAIPAAGGVQRAFGTDAKALQVGFAVEAGIRAARLAGAGATADPAAVDLWLELAGGDLERLDLGGATISGGLAVKTYPCCYALQRPIAAARRLGEPPPGRIGVSTPESTVQPLIHSRPSTGLEGKFSLEYGIAAAFLDGAPGFESFSDAGVSRPEARELMDRIEVTLTPGGEGLLAGEFTLAGTSKRDAPDPDLGTKLTLCGAEQLRDERW